MGWSLYTDRVERFVYISKLFTPSECDSIVKHGNKFSLKDATLHDPKLASKEKYSKYRDSKIYFLDSTNIEWVYERLTNAITDLNKRYFNFDLWGFGENMQFTKYISPGGKYDSHIDMIYNGTIRKLTFSLQLTDEKSYEGCDLQLHISENPVNMERAQGSLIVFPSYILHNVTPITKGTRYSLVGWVSGPPFK